MEENKFDPYQFIGFVLIAIILTWMLYDQNPENEQVVLESKKESNEILTNKDSNETNISSQQAFSLLKEQELNIEKNKLFWGELKMLQNKK